MDSLSLLYSSKDLIKLSMTKQSLTPKSTRPTCWECLRPSSHCHCELIRPIQTSWNCIILQHPREWKRYYSTSKLISRWIKNSCLLRGIEFEQAFVESQYPESKLHILFPRNANSDGSLEATPKKGTIVLLDGTWSEVKRSEYIEKMNGCRNCHMFLSQLSPLIIVFVVSQNLVA